MNRNAKKIWAAVSLKPNQTNKAEANLTQQGFPYIAPKIKVTKRQQNRFINKTELLFPGYIFVQIQAESDDARKLNSTYGISTIVRIGSRIGEIPDAFIHTIQNSSSFENSHSKEALLAGQKVELVKGPFAGLIGVLTRIDSTLRVKCLFDLISGKICASVLTEDIIAITRDC